MEHLPFPEGCKPPLAPLRYFRGEPIYDRKDFKGFLYRHGKTEFGLIDEIKRLSSQVRPLNHEDRARAQAAAGLLQEWCWFGLLDECSRQFDVAVEYEKFIIYHSEDRSDATLTTAYLAEYFKKVAGSDVARHNPEEPIRHSKLGRCVTVIDRVTMALEPLHLPAVIRTTLSYIGILCEAIQLAIKAIFLEPMPRPVRCSVPTPERWCESRRNYLDIPGSVSMRMITTSLPSFDTRLHKSCTSVNCCYAPQRPYLVVPLHTSDCDRGQCEDLIVDETHLSRIYQEGGIPGIKLTKDCPREVVVQNVLTRQYVAISHVWSHGLGNSLRNSLPWCQVNRLMQLVRNVAGTDALLWIDTLSVPHNIAWKQRAITGLRHVYREAEVVLVLDRYLEQVGTDALERSLQLLGSEWMTRLWTLQEGRLARNLCFLYKDATVHIDALIDPIAHSSREAQQNIFIDVSAVQRILKDLFVSSDDATRQFCHLAVNLAYRSVTVPSDEPICLATLLGIPLERFFNHAPSMVDVYTAFPEHLPQDLIFFNGARLPDKGLRWAPASLLRQPTFHIWTYESGTLMMDDGNVTENGRNGDSDNMTGLMVEKDYITFDGFDSSATYAVDSKYVYVTGPIVNGLEKLALFLISPPEGIEMPPLSKMAVVLHTPGNMKPPSSRAVLVEIQREVGDVVCCRFICNVQTTRGSRIDWAIKTLWSSPPVRQVDAQLRHSRLCID